MADESAKTSMKTHLMFLGKKKKEGDGTQKGVGGFRPIVNWREISIQKKKLADKQIIVCILVAGSVIIVIGLLFLLLGLFVIKRQCPFEWTGIQDRCLYVSSHNATWASARDFCIEQGGQMVDIADEGENTELRDKIKSPSWIGLYRSRQESAFQWSSRAPVAFTKFAPKPGRGGPAATQCVKMDVAGTWTAESNCSLKFVASCEYLKSYYPFVLIGPIVMVCGVIVLLLSIEVCQRHRKSKGLLDDEEPVATEDVEELQGKASPGVSNPTFDGTPTPSWRRLSSKTAPESPMLEVVITPRPTPSKAPSPASSIARLSRLSLADSSSARSTSSANLNSPHDAAFLSDAKSSQDQLELLLSPKNLR